MRVVAIGVVAALCWTGLADAQPRTPTSSLTRWRTAFANGRACDDFSYKDVGRDGPQFVDFEATPERLKPTLPKITSGYTTFRTAIRRGAVTGPNFAGHYTFVDWGVGAGGRCWAIVDARTGDVSTGGLRDEVCITTEGHDAQEPQFRVDSRLLVLSGQLGSGRVGVGYYEWTGHGLKLLRFYPWDDLCHGRVVP